MIILAKLVKNATVLLLCPHTVTIDALGFLHRFIARNPQDTSLSLTIAKACILLASKNNEHERTPRDIVDCFNRIESTCTHQEPTFLDSTSSEYLKQREEILECELKIVDSLGFDLRTASPHHLFLKLVKLFQIEDYKDFLQQCWNYLNDSLLLPESVTVHPSILAISSIKLASQRMKISVPHDICQYLSVDEDAVQSFMRLHGTLCDQRS
ncbi:hypothetical protein BLNAU_2498 [Blattamonas nauphoetae]|uniref:Cyclin-like domain-containing protein n=1 Tax=Blattamonas nauphoetae TaxID=2049346 RepID=A0ABQ9YFY4_9EUKA|nr:hypothetical protein BLNAU_2498 [Blattamonas nauphoetae]